MDNNEILTEKKINYKIHIFVSMFFIFIIVGIIAMIVNVDSASFKEQRLNRVASTFYKEIYYDKTGKTDAERAEYLKKYEEKGITFTISDLSKYSNDDILDDVSRYCDVLNSVVIVYPKSPFTNTSIETKVILECNK